MTRRAPARHRLAWLLVAAAMSGCAQGSGANWPDAQGGRFVLRWEGYAHGPDTDGRAWGVFSYEIMTPEGRGEVRRWMADNREALIRPKSIDSVPVLPAKGLYWLADDGSAETWPLWLHIPCGALSPDFSKVELLDRPWVENLPADEYERLKRIFAKYGTAVEPDHALDRVRDPCTASGGIVRRGRFVLRLRAEEGEVPRDPWTSYAIDAEPGHALVRVWIAANYEALKCSAAAAPHLAGLQRSQLHWTDDRDYVWVTLLTEIPVARGGPAAGRQAVENLPPHELERLRRIFREHGRATGVDLGIPAGTSAGFLSPPRVRLFVEEPSRAR